ncbi:hypothetical protein BpHYR1_031731, partial [Brachionus plicatilis]
PNQIQTQTTTTVTTSTTSIATTNFVPVITNWTLSINSSVKYEFHTGSNIEIICNSFNHLNKNHKILLHRFKNTSIDFNKR